VNFCKKTIILGLLAILVNLTAEAAVIDRIVAVVNDDIITLADLNSGFEPFLKRIEDNYKGKDKDALIIKTKETYLNQMIDNLLIEQEARKPEFRIVIRDEEVQQVVKDIIAKRNITPEAFIQGLAREGSSMEAFSNDIRQQMIRSRLLRLQLKKKVIVGDEEIGEYYNKHREEYEGKEAVRIKQIILLLPRGVDEQQKANIREQARQIHQRLEAKEDFDMLAAKYSQGPGSEHGGDLGFIERGMVIQEVEDAAFRLAPGQTSDVIESATGFHIIKAVDKRGAGLKPIAAVREEIKLKLEDEKMEKKYNEWMAEIRKKAHIEIRK